mmetsp:Transcript_10576/g.36915  ORF Transcript_10576/g.36915 Transcript_10576/m.36915 type:complete len:231 (-) Transcript_10576:1642-2334(-)
MAHLLPIATVVTGSYPRKYYTPHPLRTRYNTASAHSKRRRLLVGVAATPLLVTLADANAAPKRRHRQPEATRAGSVAAAVAVATGRDEAEAHGVFRVRHGHQHVNQRLAVKGLREHARETHLPVRCDVLRAAVARCRYDWRGDTGCDERSAQLIAAHATHHDVQQVDVEALLSHTSRHVHLVAVSELDDGASERAQHTLQHAPVDALVVRDGDGQRPREHGGRDEAGTIT